MTNLLKFPVLCFAMLVFASFGIAQEQAQVAIEKPGLSPEELSELEAWIEETRQAWDVPGLSVAIVWNDQVIHCKGYGVRQLGSVEAVDKDTLFAIASNSKAFTADALALLVDEGKLRWDDPVHKYLPWLRLSDPLASQDLRVRDLLCHRSGLGTFSGDLLWWGTSYSPREVLERSVHLKPATPFRANYGYSNLMFLAAGEVLSSISGCLGENLYPNGCCNPWECPDRDGSSLS